MKRIFIAVNISPENKDSLNKKSQEIQTYFELDSVKWIRKENFHITLFFLGLVPDEIITDLKKIFKKIKFNSFEIKFEEIKYIPNRREAKLIWVEGEESEKILELRKKIKNKILNLVEIDYEEPEWEFIPHITLGRTKFFQFKKTPLEEIPLLEDEFLNLKVKVESIDLMESKLKKSGPQYKIIEKFNSKI
jgi:2'-5' RNA ligase